MASEIEKFLFGHYGTHALINLSLSVDQVVVAVAPWTDVTGVAEPDLTRVTEAIFEQATLLSVWSTSDTSSQEDEDFTLPWDIIEFASTRQPDERWEFVLYCSVVEFTFLAKFPKSKKLTGAV